jgi:hypothetical protein
MKTSQLTRGLKRRVMYVENKEGLLEGARAWIGWVEFSKSGRTIYYKGRSLQQIRGKGYSGNFRDTDSGAEYWISGIKKRGSNAHPAERAVTPVIDEDARSEYDKIRNG